MKMKAQSAMEYLMTYGWAILIVIIVAAALFALGVFNPGTYTQSTATGFVGFNIPAGGWVMNSSGFTLILKNAMGFRINVTDIDMTYGTQASTGVTPDVTAYAWEMAPNAQKDFAIAGIDASTAGTSYTVDATISYTNLETGFAGQATGTITGTSS